MKSDWGQVNYSLNDRMEFCYCGTIFLVDTNGTLKEEGVAFSEGIPFLPIVECEKSLIKLGLRLGLT